MSSEEERSAELLTAAGIPAPLGARLALYSALVLEANRRLNLTGAATPEEFIPHVLDSLTLLPYAASPLIDVGSGAGLPGLPLAIAGGLNVTLIDARSKKAAFLREAASRLGLEVAVETGRAEDLGRREGRREMFMSATARGLSTAPAVLELISPFLKVGGLAILQRGALDATESRALEEACLVLNCRLEDSIEQRENSRVLLIRKTGPTPERFPRRTGIPQKKPLGVRNVPRETF